MIVYEVKTYGGQIIDYQTPRECEVPAWLEKVITDSQSWKELGFFFTDNANYYATRQRAMNAVIWALSN